MANVGAVVSSIRNIMRQDRGISGDAQRLEQLGWMLFLKIIDDKDQELEITKDDYVSVIPEKFQWRTWATDSEGITGDELLEFIDSNAESNRGLFATLRNLTSNTNPKRAAIVKEVFEGSNNFMKSGYEMRKVINKLNEVDFNNSKDKQVFGDIYESILVELRDAGNKGEYYTPRAVTQLMTKMTNPILGEKVLDPAAGTGGFLTEAIDHVRAHYVHTVKDEHKLQNSITGWELKPVAYVLGLTNLILHEIDIPDYVYQDSLKVEYNGIKAKDKVDVILANPPFGASIADGVETNFPASYRCKESADLFLILMLQLLKPNGRCAIVLPDSCITGEGVKARIREKLLTDANLHTIVRLPDSTFHPATVPTNLLFFEKGSPTKEIWYYEHKLPENQKSYSKTKPIKFSEFSELLKWWNSRVENESAWKVNVSDLTDWNLDIENPVVKRENLGNSKEHFSFYNAANDKFNEILKEISVDLSLSNHETIDNVISNHSYLFKNEKFIEILKELILEEAFNGKLTENWRNQYKPSESASELINRIASTKFELEQKKLLKKQKKLPKVTENQTLFLIPENWEWSRLGEIAQHNAGKTLHKGQNTGDFKDYITTSNLYWGRFKLDTIKKIQLEEKELERCTAVKGDLLICEGGDVGRSAIWDKDYEICFQNHIHRVRPFCDMNNEYLFYFMMYLHKSGLIKKYKKGMGIGNLSGTALSSIILPIAPAEEQVKIVDKVKLLMDKCSLLILESKKCEKNAQLLMKSALKEAFENEEKPVKTIESMFESENYDIYVAMIIQQIENRLRINYGEVAMQKTVFNFNTFTPENIPYQFINSNYGTFSPQLKEDLQKNPYLTKTNKGHGDVFAIKKSKNKDVLDAMTTAQNKPFMVAINNVLDIYEMPFINKETDKIELLNTVTKCVLDTKTNDLEKVYQAMQNWEIKQKGCKTKTDKFSKSDTKKMLQLIDNLGLMKK